jgi:hypothetical protein
VTALHDRLAELARVEPAELGAALLPAFAADLADALATARAELGSLAAVIAAAGQGALADRAAAARAFADLAELTAALDARATQVSGHPVVQVGIVPRNG